MNKRLKKFITGLAILSLAQGAVYGAELQLTYDNEVHYYNKENITLYVNNLEVQSSVMPPIQLDGYVYVPIREVFDAMHAKVQWKQTEKKVYIESGDSLVVLELNSNEAWVDGDIKIMNTPMKVVNEKIMVPIRFISEALGFNVQWIAEGRSVYISNGVTPEWNVPNEIEDSTSDKEDITNNIIEDTSNILWPEEVVEVVPTTSVLTEKFHAIDYNEATQTMLLSQDLGISSANITVEERTMKRQLIFNIKGCDTTSLMEGSWQGSLGHIKGVTVSKTDSTMQICVQTDVVCAEQITSESGAISIKFVTPREKYDKIIVIDPGHGGDDGGTAYGNISEKNLTLSYGKALYHLLEQDPSIKVYTTRAEDLYGGNEGGVAGKQYPTLDMRVNMSNEIKPDLYISIHINSYGTTPNGVETYYYNLASDTRGKAFATMVQKALVNEFNMNNRNVKTAEYYVIKNTNEPAILIETGFITNSNDRAILTSSTYPTRFANAVYNCIVNYYAQGLNK